MKVDVSLDLYRIFCAVVRTGNMSAAARELFISQPAVSMSIRQVEDRMESLRLARVIRSLLIFCCLIWKGIISCIPISILR